MEGDMTDNHRHLVGPEESILVLGSLNAKEEDRCHNRAEIRPVQVFIDGEVVPIAFFDDWGELGVSSVAQMGGDALFLTTGSELVKINLRERGDLTRFNIQNLKDVHELTIINGSVWLANTGADEVLEFDIKDERVVERIQLAPFRLSSGAKRRSYGENQADVREVDRFHCNQVFKGLDGDLYVLVHHTSGRQLMTRIANKLVKRQGDGGVIDLGKGRGVPLGLRGPHSVRVVVDDYWVFDSGGGKINVYDRDWNAKKSIQMKGGGWGRGADVSRKSGLFYAGISETRKRYREDGEESSVGNMVEVFDPEECVSLGEIPIPHGIEQINNVYVISRPCAEALFNLS